MHSFAKFADEGWTIGLPSWGGIQESVAGGQFIGYVIFMLFVAWVAYNGIDQIKWVQNIGSPILIVVMIGTALLGLLHYSGRNRILRSYGSAK